jgi:hypothetical protein
MAKLPLTKKTFTDALDKELKKLLDKVKEKPLKTFLKKRIVELLKDSPEYKALLPKGELRKLFGITKIASLPESIADNMMENLSFKVFPGKKSIDIQFFTSDLSEALTVDEASYITEKGEEFKWLEILLTQGDNTIFGFTVVKNTGSSKSRTSSYIMTESDKGWRVPPEFSGNESNNWLTRALIPQLELDIQKYFEDFANVNF